MLVPIRQRFPKRGLPDVAAAVRDEMEQSGLASRVTTGARIAIGVGSRGISNIATIARAVVDYWRAHGMRPFLFPAMGSHGAGTPEGQISVLEHYGVTETAMDCPIRSSFDVISLGTTSMGFEAFAGRDAWESDGVFLVNRVKWHTSFAGPLESGVSKMMAIGLGKLAGAETSHTYARKHGMSTVVRSVAELVLGTGHLLGGLAIAEDASHDTALVKALAPEGLPDREEELLRTVKSWMPRLPLENIDVLMVDEIGKNIAGTGMDLKIVNRGVNGHYNPWPDTPVVERIFVRDLSESSYGNATGVGLADVVHDRLLAKIHYEAGLVNARTSGSLSAVKIPIHFDNDRDCFELVRASVGRRDVNDASVVWIRNTLELGYVAVSENAVLPGMEIAGPAFDLDFDSGGNLDRLPLN